MTEFATDWSLYRSLLAVLDEGSLSGAARALGMSQPTLGRHVEALEADLGVSLFTRSPQGLRPTEAALSLRPQAEAMASAARALKRAASETRGVVSGAVRVTASEIIGAEVLPPMIATLQDRHPALVIELVLSNQLEDLIRRDADIAVRMVQPTQGALVSRRVGTVELGLYGEAGYLARHGTPATLDDIDAAHRLVGFDGETAFIRGVMASGVPLNREMFSLRTDSDLAQLAAVRAGCGLGVVQGPLAARWGLTRVAPAFRFSLDTWLVMHEDLKASARCRAVFDGLAEGLRDYMAPARG